MRTSELEDLIIHSLVIGVKAAPGEGVFIEASVQVEKRLLKRLSD